MEKTAYLDFTPCISTPQENSLNPKHKYKRSLVTPSLGQVIMPECLATWLRITAMKFQKYSPNVNLSNDLPSTIGDRRNSVYA